MIYKKDNPIRISAWKKLQNSLYLQSFEALQNISTARLKVYGSASLVGNLVFGVIWLKVVPQPYENMLLRVLLAALGGVMALRYFEEKLGAYFFTRYCLLMIWLGLPVFFGYMLIRNEANLVWTCSYAAMILIFFQIVDWRIALCGLLLSWAGIAVWFFTLGANYFSPVTSMTEIGFVVVFCLAIGLLLSYTSANIRKAEIQRTFTLMGIMAHELRTPIASIQLGTEILGSEGARSEVICRIRSAIKRVHWNIDTQMNNARFGVQRSGYQRVSMAALLQDCIQTYPYRTPEESQIVALELLSDFTIDAAPGELRQLFDNLMKNALYSLAKTQRPLEFGDIRLVCSLDGTEGRVSFADKGAGMSRFVQQSLFKPFFSTNQQTAHGLGLAYCKSVMLSLHGDITCQSALDRGAVFYLRFPCAVAPLDEDEL